MGEQVGGVAQVDTKTIYMVYMEQILLKLGARVNAVNIRLGLAGCPKRLAENVGMDKVALGRAARWHVYDRADQGI